MLFDTIGFNFFLSYLFQASVTDALADLKRIEAKDYYRIIFIKNGPSHFLLNGKEFVLTGACAICMNERDQISFLDVKQEGVKILWFRPAVVNGIFTYDNINNKDYPFSQTEYQDLYYLHQFRHDAKETMKILSLHTMDSAVVEHKLQVLKEMLLSQNSDRWPCRSRSYLFEVLFCLARQEEEEERADQLLQYEGRSRLAVDVIYYLQSSYNQKITIEKLAEEFHTNRTTLLNDFKKYTGQSVNSYLIQLRLMMASTMLRDTQLPVEEICERTGFSDISYFSKVFKKKLYYTPSEYRRRNKSTE